MSLKTLKNKILKICQKDQSLRILATTGNGKFDKSLAKKVYQCDGENLKEIKKIIEKYGYPTFDLIGKEASHAFWLLVQHSDRDLKFQKKCLKLLEKNVEINQAKKRDFEYLTDRILVAEGKEQIYHTQITYSSEIYKLFMKDQKDHSGIAMKRYNIDDGWKNIEKRGKERQGEIIKIIKDKSIILTGEDYFMAGMIFQHGTTIADSKKAIALTKKGIKLKNDKCKWLYASAIDRLLMRQKKKQKFGTQYVKRKNGKWFLYPVNPKTNDKERMKYNVIPLKQAQLKAKEWNKKSINPWQEKRKTIGITSIK